MPQKHQPFVPEKRAQCCGKNVYFNKHEAERVAEDQLLLTYGLLLTVYRCTCGCGGWHLARTASSSTKK